MQNKPQHAEGTAHAKAILSGEHSVVYGHPAIAFPVHSLRLTATADPGTDGVFLQTAYSANQVTAESAATAELEKRLAELALANTLSFVKSPLKSLSVTVEGVIPPARGLGSSAAVAAAIADAVAQFHGVVLTHEERFDIVQSVEKVAHGTPSGLDAHATTSSTPLWFHNGRVEQIDPAAPLHMVIADSGIMGSTASAVEAVHRARASNSKRVDGVLNDISEITFSAKEHLIRGDTDALGRVMIKNHMLLHELGVSREELDNLVRAASDSGALGAKLTGGGLGGCIIALVDSEAALSEMKKNLLRAGAVSVWNLNSEPVRNA